MNFRRLCIAVAVSLSAASSSAIASTTIIHVNAAQPPGGNGTSWTTAYVDLQDALADAATITGEDIQIWIAAGTYKPGTAEDGPEATFNLVSGIALYGGFAGGETSLEQRDWEVNETILSGVLGNNVRAESVVTGTNLTMPTRLDGLTVTGALTEWPLSAKGGGVRLVNSVATVANCVIVDNIADTGGGIAIENGELNVVDTTFLLNLAWGPQTEYGGGLFADSSDVVITGCLFTNNAAFELGASIAVIDSTLTATSCTFDDHFGGLLVYGIIFSHGSDVTIEDSLFIENGTGDPTTGCLVVVDSDVAVTNTDFISNHFDGAAILSGSDSTITFDDCLMLDNGVRGLWGSGHLSIHNTEIAGNHWPGTAVLWDGTGEMHNSSIRDYSDTFFGGGLVWTAGNLTVSNAVIVGNGRGVSFSGESFTMMNTLIADNVTEFVTGGVGVNADVVTIINNTIIDNASWDGVVGGLQIDAGTSATVANSIIWGNGGREGAIQVSGPVDVSHSLVQSESTESWPGEGNINVDPLLADDDGRLSSNSPAIDAGSNDLVPPEITTDLDGQPRIVDGTGDGVAVVDMGAFEFQCAFADLNCDGVVNVFDLLQLLAAWGPCDDCAPAPGMCPADLEPDCTVNVFDLLALLAAWG